MTPSSQTARSLTAAVCAALAALALGPATAKAARPVLQKSQARDLAAKTADKVRRDLKSEGARGAGVAGCWRNSVRRVSCYLKVTGYDAELDFRWTCMLRIIVELRVRHDGTRRLHSRYGDAACG
jgi:hypothetical protein